MPVQITKKTDETNPEVTQPVEPRAPVALTVVLELALYKHYTWGKDTYVQNQPYRFSQDVALRLLRETDAGRQVWKQYTPKPVKRVVRPVVEDATHVTVPIMDMSDVEIGADPNKRIEVGTDDEIRDVLTRPDDDDSDNITV